eukprot:TRINITY_DN6236_c0_g1_i1.p1 TRINITY_DN6236_c0_g1~~TRINITY_DN6236_c0_g1_i1.p1  ORF type:complete len:835 (+),score=167.85 TRINITY_DN6236_c0_g1_i1:246-2750(+)
MFAAFKVALCVTNTQQAKIHCAEQAGDKLLLGTADGFVLLYKLDFAPGQEAPRFTMLNKKGLGRGRKPVTQIRTVEDIDKAFTLCDGQVDVLTLSGFELIPNTIAWPKGITGICWNLGYMFVQGKKKIYQLDLYGQQLRFIKEMNIQSSLRCVEWARGDIFLVGTKKNYAFFNMRSGECTILFPLDRNDKPLIKRLTKEFVLRSGTLGVFLGFDGQPTRGNISWSSAPLDIGFRFPYIIALLPNMIQIHNIVDQSLIQSTGLNHTPYIISDKNSIIACAPNSISVLVPMPIEHQLEELMRTQRIKEAKLLLKHSHQGDPRIKEELERLSERAGLALLANMQVQQAFKQFEKSRIDGRELLSLYPRLLPASTTFRSKYTPLDLSAQKYLPYEREIKGRIVEFLEKRHHLFTYSPSVQEDIDTGLVKLYIEFRSANLFSFLSVARVNLSDLEQSLKNNESYFIIGHCYAAKNFYQEALDVWARVAANSQTNNQTRNDCVEATVNLLSAVEDVGLIFKHSTWLFNSHPLEAVKVFTANPNLKMAPTEILDFISKYGVQPTQAYLEHLVFVAKSTEERFHTRLLNIYLEFIQPLLSVDTKKYTPGTEPGLLGPLRSKLINLLDTSVCYNYAAFLSKIEDNPAFDIEKVILYGKLGNHFKALQELVQKIGNPQLADEYCQNHKHEREDLFVLLLKVYLGLGEKDTSCSGITKNISPIVYDLLLSRAGDLPPSQVANLLPPDAPLNKLLPYFQRSIQSHLHQLRDGQVVKNLRKYENLETKYQLLRLKSRSVVITRDKVCGVCHTKIGDKVFACYPNGVLVHYKCFTDKHVCPVTGRVFK